MNQPAFLKRLISEATRIWSLHPGDIGQSEGERAVRARTAITILAYEYDCTPYQIAGAFGWKHMKRATRESRAFPRHNAFLQYEIYRERFAELEEVARQVGGEP